MENTGKRLMRYVPDYVVFDLETTGISWSEDAIVEISALKVKNAVITDRFSTLVNPQRSIPYHAYKVHGISDQMVADAPCLKEALTGFLDFIGEDVLVGHNIASFDLKFIYRDVQQLFGRTVTNNYIDTLYMARSCLPQLSHHRLTDLADYFQLDTQGAHRALWDCTMNQACYEKMAKLTPAVQLEICPKCGGELKKRTGKFGEFFGCSNFPSCRFTKNIKKE